MAHLPAPEVANTGAPGPPARGTLRDGAGGRGRAGDGAPGVATWALSAVLSAGGGSRGPGPDAMGNRSAAEADGLLGARGAGGGGAWGAAAALVGGVLLIGAVLAGNSLVCVSVAAERALQTPTNYFIVSLAAADLLLALLVLPLFVYSEVSVEPTRGAPPAPSCPVPATRRPRVTLPLASPGAPPVLAFVTTERPLSFKPGTPRQATGAAQAHPPPPSAGPHLPGSRLDRQGQASPARSPWGTDTHHCTGHSRA